MYITINNECLSMLVHFNMPTLNNNYMYYLLLNSYFIHDIEMLFTNVIRFIILS